MSKEYNTITLTFKEALPYLKEELDIAEKLHQEARKKYIELFLREHKIYFEKQNKVSWLSKLLGYKIPIWTEQYALMIMLDLAKDKYSYLFNHDRIYSFYELCEDNRRYSYNYGLKYFNKIKTLYDTCEEMVKFKHTEPGYMTFEYNLIHIFKRNIGRKAII